ncbi:unnamed protein product [Lasius platythorax]|uniref:Uncharacterized protein n=1 Tax=Lasius platythorax TaxID=488582 RepID=A0AAV2P8X0_9HYME
MSLHLVTADARYSLSWGSLLLDEPVTRSLFVILILSSRGSVHSGVKRAFSTATLRRFSLLTILALRRFVAIILQQIQNKSKSDIDLFSVDLSSSIFHLGFFIHINVYYRD